MTTSLNTEEQSRFMELNTPEIKLEELHVFLSHWNLIIKELEENNPNRYGIMNDKGTAIFFDSQLENKHIIDFIKNSGLFSISKPTEAEVMRAIRNSKIYCDRILIKKLETITITIQQQDWGNFNVFNNYFLFNGQVTINIKDNENGNIILVVNFYSQRGKKDMDGNITIHDIHLTSNYWG